MGYRSTTSAAAILGVPYFRLAYLIRARRISPPARDDTGNYAWSEADIERARAALAARRSSHPATQTGGNDAA